MLHADVCTQGPLLQSADVIVMNNVFEYFLTEAEQARYVIYLSKKSVIKYIQQGVKRDWLLR